MNKLTIELKDKEGIKFVELDPKKKYFILITNKEFESLSQIDYHDIRLLEPYLASKVVITLNDINNLTVKEKSNFLKMLSPLS